MLRILGSPKRLCNGVIRRELLTSLIVFAALCADLAVADDQSPSSQPITIDNPQLRRPIMFRPFARRWAWRTITSLGSCNSRAASC